MMKKLGIVFIICLLAVSVEAKTKHKKKKATRKADITVLEAYTQNKTGGARANPMRTTGQHFVVIWNGASYPETFFWRGDNGYLGCMIEKAHRISSKNANKFPKGMDYTTEAAAGDAIHKGDTLMISPYTGGKFPVPAEVPATAKNTLYYTTGGSKLLSCKITNITRKHDITLP